MEELDEIFDKSELVYQVKKYYNSDSAKEMIQELKDEIIKLINNLQIKK
jgi:hypothetical protein